MAEMPWAKFFWSDWESDESLDLCSLAAQGLWMRMLCIAAKADPVGHVVINGRPLEVVDIAKLAGSTESECAPLLSELERNGVFSRTRKGVIYSRRMVRDVKKIKIAKKNGKKGGNPNLKSKRATSGKQTRNPKSDNQAPNPPDNQGVENQDKLKKLEARSQKLDNTTSSVVPRPREAADDDFEKLDRKLRAIPGIERHPVATDPVIATIWNLAQAGYHVDHAIIPAVTAQVAKAKPGKIKSWAYFVARIVESAQAHNTPPPVTDDTTWVKRIDFGRRRSEWDAKWGPMPNQPGSIVPAHLVQPTDGAGWKLWQPEGAAA